MKINSLAILFLCVLMFGSNAIADEFKGNKYGYRHQSGTVNNVADNGDIFLEDGKILKPAAIMLNSKVILFLKESLIGNEIEYWSKNNKTDRHNRIISQINMNGKWLQCSILKSGDSIASPSPLSKDITDDLYKCEKLNNIAFFVSTNDAYKFIGDYKIISGKIYSTYQSKKNLYINFDEDWKTDFSIMISNNIAKEFKPEQLTKLTTTGKTIRIRGRIEKYNGPIIKLTHLKQIEFLEN